MLTKGNQADESVHTTDDTTSADTVEEDIASEEIPISSTPLQQIPADTILISTKDLDYLLSTVKELTVKVAKLESQMESSATVHSVDTLAKTLASVQCELIGVKRIQKKTNEYITAISTHTAAIPEIKSTAVSALANVVNTGVGIEVDGSRGG